MSRWRVFQGALRIGVLGICVTLVSSPVIANCFSPGEELSSQGVQAFLADPAALLNGPGSARLTSRVRDLAASDPATLSALVLLMKSAPVAQQRNIGLGLALAANQCEARDPDYAADIQQKVAESDAQAAIAWFDRTRRGSGGNIGGFAGGISDLRPAATGVVTARSFAGNTTFAEGAIANSAANSAPSLPGGPVIRSVAGTTTSAAGAFAGTTSPGSANSVAGPVGRNFALTGAFSSVIGLALVPSRSVSP